MKQTGKPKCSQHIHPRGMAFSHGHTCSRKGVVQHDGKWYCKQHDPEAIATYWKARNAKWEAKWAAQEAAEKHRLAVERARERVIKAAKDWANIPVNDLAIDAALKDAVDRLEKLGGE